MDDKKTDALDIYHPKGKVVCIGTIDENGEGKLKLSTKEYRKSKKWIYAVKEGYQPTRFKLHRKFNIPMVADVIFPLSIFFDHANVLNGKKVYEVSLNSNSMCVNDFIDQATILRKQRRKERWDKIFNNLEIIGGALVAVGQVLDGEQPVSPDVSSTYSSGSYINESNTNGQVYNSELEKEKHKLQQLYIERQQIQNRMTIHQKEVSSAGSKKVSKAGSSLKLNKGTYRLGQGNYGIGKAERGAKMSSDLKVELRNVNKRIETCERRIRMLENGEVPGQVRNTVSKSESRNGADVYFDNVNDRTYRNWEGQLSNMHANWATQYNDSQRREIQAEMRRLRIKYNLQKSSWEDWDGSK